MAGGFVSERSEHFSCLGRAAGNGETRQRARKGVRLVGYEPKACTPKPWTSCTPSLESSSQKQGYRRVLAKHARPDNLHSFLDFNQRSYIDSIDGIDWTSKAGKAYPSLYSEVAGGFVTQFGRNRTCPKDSVVILLTDFACDSTCPKDFVEIFLTDFGCKST